MVGPDYVQPDVAVNDTWLQAQHESIKTDPVDQIAWWTTFNDPVLDTLVEQAYAQNLTLRQAAVLVIQSMAERGIAVGDLFPQTQDVNGFYDRSRFTENPPGPSDYANTWSVSFDAAWELDVWGLFRRNIESADASLDASLASYDDVMVSLVSEVALSYVTIRTLQNRVAIAEANVALEQKGLDLANWRFKLGATSELDVVQAKSVLEQTRASIPAAQSELYQAMYQLSVLLGTPPRDLSDQLGASGAIPAAPAEVAIGVPADLLRRRPDIRVAERRAAALSAQIGVAEALLYPAFSLSGSLGLQSDSSGNLFDSSSWTGYFAPGFSWPILNYGRLRNNVRVQDAAFQAAIFDYQNSVLVAAEEVESGIAAFLGAQEQVVYLLRSETASKRAVHLATVRYTEGKSTYTRVLNSQEQLRDVQNLLVSTQGQVAANLIATYKALGGGWQIRQGLDIVPDDTRRQMEQRTDWGDLLQPDSVSGSDLLVPRHDPDWRDDGGSSAPDEDAHDPSESAP